MRVGRRSYREGRRFCDRTMSRRKGKQSEWKVYVEEWRERLGDVFYGDDDIVEINALMYKEDVIESMRRARELKELGKIEKRRRSSFFNRCFEFLTPCFFQLLRHVYTLSARCFSDSRF